MGLGIETNIRKPVTLYFINLSIAFWSSAFNSRESFLAFSAAFSFLLK